MNTTRAAKYLLITLFALLFTGLALVYVGKASLSEVIQMGVPVYALINTLISAWGFHKAKDDDSPHM
jgi:hypothetical protein